MKSYLYEDVPPEAQFECLQQVAWVAGRRRRPDCTPALLHSHCSPGEIPLLDLQGAPEIALRLLSNLQLSVPVPVPVPVPVFAFHHLPALVSVLYGGGKGGLLPPVVVHSPQTFLLPRNHLETKIHFACACLLLLLPTLLIILKLIHIFAL